MKFQIFKGECRNQFLVQRIHQITFALLTVIRQILLPPFAFYAVGFDRIVEYDYCGSSTLIVQSSFYIRLVSRAAYTQVLITLGSPSAHPRLS